MYDFDTRHKVASGTANPTHFWSGNCQEIREELLRQAVKSCDMYATDILILLERSSGTMEAFLKVDGHAHIEIYFMRSGCAWALKTHEGLIGNVGSLPFQYRAAMVLTKEPHPEFSDEYNFALYSLSGTV